MEECLLRFALAAGNKLDIIDNQHIHGLIEPDEVIDVSVLDSLDILLVESIGTDVNDGFVRKIDFCLDTDSVDEMGLSQADFGIDEQRVEGRLSRVVGNCLTG